jgi:hypothetical protein
LAQVLGIIDAVWGGQKIPLEKGATFSPGGYKQTAVIVSRQVHYSQEVVASKLEGTTVLQAGQRLDTLIPPGAQEMQVICDTGQSFIIPDMFRLEVPDVTGGEGGKIKITWNGSPATEIA